MQNKIIIIILVILAMALGVYVLNLKKNSSVVSNFSDCERAGYPVGESYPRQCFSPDGRHFVEEIPGLPGETITVNGEITCLSKRGNGAQTMECAIGFLALDGNQYALKNLQQFDPEYKFSQGGMSVVVTGIFIADNPKGPDGNPYDVIGAIDVQSIKER